jgi:hypothetical protein
MPARPASFFPAAFGVRRLAGSFLLVSVLGAPSAFAQDWAPQPVTALDGRFTLRGDATVTVGGDDTGYFNYTDYDHSTLHLVRFDATAALRAGEHFTFLTELRAEGDSLHGEWLGAVYAAFVRYRPWAARSFDVSGGRVPAAFGAYPGRSYSTDNLLIGSPLAFQYLTAVRSDAVPADADQLALMRGRGWLVEYPIGDQTPATGLPVVSLAGYDSGILVRAGSTSARVQSLFSVTAGTLGYPSIDHNGSPQFAGRLVVRPAIGLVLGASAASGHFLEQSVIDLLPTLQQHQRFPQRAWGADAEYSRAYWLVRAEVVASDWRLPVLGAPFIDRPLGSVAWYAEGRYKIVPGLYAAARYDRMTFDDIQTSLGKVTWDARVSRVEAGVGYSLARWLLIKATIQHNSRDGGRVQTLTLPALQAVLWF